ncbi:MAG: hypothetical protein LW884_07495 [Bacteroidetes bacterium]|nr:hypothetical protein [Bacteroidota bacterium]
MARKIRGAVKPQVNAALKGFDVEINAFGEIVSSYDINKLNQFLDEKVDDKKFKGVDVVKRTHPGEGEGQDEAEEESAPHV